jgi:hypothetical protein
MFRFVRMLALWLAALAIPLQGIAAVAMPFCPPAHSAAMPVASADPSGAHRMGRHAPDAAAGHSHPADGHVHAAGSSHDAAAADTDQAKHGGNNMVKCHGIGGTIASAFAIGLVSRTQPPSTAPLQPAAQIYQGVILDGLERPPRPFPA